MTKKIAFAGAHRCGKTMLGNALAEKRDDTVFVQVDVAGMLAKCGFHARDNVAFEDRLRAQVFVLDSYKKLLTEPYETPVVIFDRSPFCFLAYTVSEYNRSANICAENDKALTAYIEDCLAVASTMDAIFCLKILPEIVDCEKSAQPSRPYCQHLEALVEYYATQNTYKERACASLESRTQYIDTMINLRFISK